MKIRLVNKEILKEGLALRRLEKLIREIVGNEKKKLGAIEIILLNDQDLLKINTNFLKHNYFTDVITFDYNRKDKIIGDIFISIESVRSNADEFGQDFMNEMIRVIIHGVLHLTGYEDSSDKEKKSIRDKEDFYLCRFKEIENE